jgi:FMN phosphatase YigB (HAD superfamily)
MIDGVKAIIFDWSGTLHDKKGGVLYDGVADVLAELSAKYVLALISLAASETSEERRKVIGASGVARYFEIILVDDKNKDAMYENALAQLRVSPKEVAVVDDRVIRGVAWGNRHGATTIWVRRGEFADDMPTAATGEPTIIIKDVRDLRDIFIKSIL